MSGTTDTFDYTGSVISYTVQSTGLYDITAFGAQGGNGSFTTAGDGAKATGDILLTQGETLSIIVGGEGGGPTTSGINGAGGGGGGSFVIAPGPVPLVVAGGGGGASAFPPQNGVPGAGGNLGDSAGPPSEPFGSPDYHGGLGGVGGQGGQGGTMIGFYPGFLNSAAGGGAGVLSPGTDGQASGGGQNVVGAGGQDPTGGAAGGLGSFYAGSGGFGGGGGGAGIAGGGGGGYSGGAGAADAWAGGGGGSFVDPSAQNAVLTEGGRAGNGLVTLTEIAEPPNVLNETNLSAKNGSTVTLTQSQLLAGDSDPQGGNLTVTAVNGTGAVLNKDGSVTLTAPVRGTMENFGFTVTDTAGLSTNATATVNLTPPAMRFTTSNTASDLETFTAGSVHLAGLGSVIGAIAKLRQHKDNPTRIPNGLPRLDSLLSNADLNSFNLPALASSHAATSGAAGSVEAGSSANLQQMVLSELHSGLGMSVINPHWP